MDLANSIGLVGVILAVAALYYAIRTYNKEHKDKPNEDKLHLMASFKATQKLSHDVFNELSAFVEQHNVLENEMYPGLTFRTCLSQIKTAQEKTLSDELYEKCKKESLPTMTIQSMSNSLDKQLANFLQIQADIQMLKQRNSL
jgi:hypothetical protein